MEASREAVDLQMKGLIEKGVSRDLDQTICALNSKFLWPKDQPP